jgi:hypothetical protein
MRSITDSSVLNAKTPSRHDVVSVAAVDQNQERLQRMIRKTMRMIRNSEALVQQTNKLLEQFQTLSHLRIKRPDNRINQSFRQT